jgi:hypothetical protein
MSLYEFHPEIKRPGYYPPPIAPFHPRCHSCQEECHGHGEHQPGVIRGFLYCPECYEELQPPRLDTLPIQFRKRASSARSLAAFRKAMVTERKEPDTSNWFEFSFAVEPFPLLEPKQPTQGSLLQ